jgi:hypothetical protein
VRQFSKKVKKDIRDKVIPVRFTALEQNFVKAVSAKFNISLSEFIRRSALQRRMPPQAVAEVNRKTYQELCRIGNNLNQLMRQLNSGTFLVLDKDFFIELKELVKNIGLNVVGAKIDSQTS